MSLFELTCIAALVVATTVSLRNMWRARTAYGPLFPGTTVENDAGNLYHSATQPDHASTRARFTVGHIHSDDSGTVGSDDQGRRGPAMNAIEVDPIFPEMDASSAVYPTARLVGNDLYLAYRLAPDCRDSAVVVFESVASWQYGAPNDEGLREHPLWGKGLTFYNFHRSGIAPSPGTAIRWTATFHDGTFEISARRAVVAVDRHRHATPSEALTALLGPGNDRILDDHAA